MHLGTKSLRRLLAQEIHYPENFRDRTFHWGDVLYETDVGDSGGGLGRRLRRPAPLISADAAATTTEFGKRVDDSTEFGKRVDEDSIGRDD